MITVAKGMVACSALVALGIVSAIDLANSWATEPSPTAVVADRFPAPHEVFGPLKVVGENESPQAAGTAHKGDRLSSDADCARQQWPYFARQCLVSQDGSPVREVSRVVTLERRIGPATSELVRVPINAVAQHVR
jgi:hypothetical protein